MLLTRSAIAAALVAVSVHSHLALASGYERQPTLLQSQGSRLDIHLKRWSAAVRTVVPPPFGFRMPERADSAIARLPRVPVLIALESAAMAAAIRLPVDGGTARMGRIVSTFLGADDLAAVGALPGVRRIEMRQAHRLHLDVNTAKNGAIAARQASGLDGGGVLIGLIDSGIDTTHADFRHADGSTRVVALWDQVDDSFAVSGGTIGSAPPERNASGQPLGTVYTAAQIDAALGGVGTVNSLDLVGHGSHVAGCAASDGRAPGAYIGVAPDADLIVVRAGGTSKRDFTFDGDIVGGLHWIDEQAAARQEPVVVNMSFGQHFGAHDDTSAEEIAIDEFVATPGRVVSVSAGNERGVAIHSSGSTRGGQTLAAEVASADADLFAVDCWIPGSDIVDWAFQDPIGDGVTRANVREGQCVVLENHSERVSLCVDFINPVNGDREVFTVAEPLDAHGAIDSGRWQVTLLDQGRIVNGHYDCWSVNGQPFVAGGDSLSTVAIPGTARGAITAGAATLRDHWPSQQGDGTQIGTPVVDDLAAFSSSGPTRDGRIKPDIVTGGQWVLSAWSVADGSGSGLAGDPVDLRRVSADGTHVAGRGTSFSAPQVAGAVALLLQATPTLTASAVAEVLRSTAQRDAFTGVTPNVLWGYGKLDIAAAVATVATVAPACVADCNGDGVVSVEELVDAVRIALGLADPAQCGRADHDGNGRVTVDELEIAVNAALHGCR